MRAPQKVKFAVLVLLTLTACEKKDNPLPSETITITTDYPADYYAVVPVKDTVQCSAASQKEQEKQIEKRVQEVVRKREVQKKQEQVKKKKALIQQKKEDESSYQTYLLTRSTLIREMRRLNGGSFLDIAENKEPPESVLPSHTVNPKELKDKGYKSPNVLSSYPVDRSFILTQDRTINAVLLDGINSQIGGNVRVMIAEDVFGANGRYKLLEKGDVVLGTYNATNKVGETRLSVLFYRIIRAVDGAEVYASGDAFAYAADKMGRTGLVGEVDNRNWERYGLAFSTSLIGGLAGLGKSKADGDEFEEFWDRLSDNTTEITSKILEQYMNIAPVITIAQGEPVLVRLMTDITLKQGKEGERL